VGWISFFRDTLKWRLPHPGYGKCGGADKDCSPNPPIDEMDKLFYEHDMNLYSADQLPEPERTQARKESDWLLHAGLKNLDSSKLSLYGKIYRVMAIFVFR